MRKFIVTRTLYPTYDQYSVGKYLVYRCNPGQACTQAMSELCQGSARRLVNDTQETSPIKTIDGDIVPREDVIADLLRCLV